MFFLEWFHSRSHVLLLKRPRRNKWFLNPGSSCAGLDFPLQALNSRGVYGFMDKTEVEAWERFEFLEQSLGLDEWKVSGVYAWKIVRHQRFNLYLSELEPMANCSNDRSKVLSALSRLPSLLLHMFLANPYLSVSSKSKPLSISSPREELRGKRVVDTIADRDFLRSHLENSNVLFTSEGSIAHLRNGQKANSIPLLLGRFLAIFQKVALTKEDVSKLRLISEDLLEFSSFPSSNGIATHNVSQQVSIIKTQIRREIAIFKGTKLAYGLLFRIMNPSRLYVFSSCSWQAIVAAAKAKSIEVVEFQHGLVSSGVADYDFRFWREVPYFPDVFLAWGGDWFCNLNFPNECKIHIVGPNSKQTKLFELKNIQSNEKRLLVLSQGKLTAELLSFVRTFLELRPDWQAIVKPHPTEISLEKYENLETPQESSSSNLHLHKGDLYSALLRSHVVVGQSSTAIFEAAFCGRKAVIVTGKYMVPHEIAKKCDVTLVQTPQELARQIDYLRTPNTSGLFTENNLDLERFFSYSGA